jgi:putative peptidoglycan lipid II flippase
MRLIQFPLGIFGVALSTAILPTLSAQAARGALDELRTTIGFGLRMIFFIILPAMAGLILLRYPIVHLVFEHGSFTRADTIAFAGVRIIVSAFYSLQDTKTPAVTAAIAVGANIGLSLWLMTMLDAAGLALATALASMLNGTILVALLHRRLGRVEWGTILRSGGRVLVACGPMVLICLGVASAPLWSETGQWIMKSALLFGGIALSVAAYLGMHVMLGSDELGVVLGLVKRKFGRLARKLGIG